MCGLEKKMFSFERLPFAGNQTQIECISVAARTLSLSHTSFLLFNAKMYCSKVGAFDYFKSSIKKTELYCCKIIFQS